MEPELVKQFCSSLSSVVGLAHFMQTHNTPSLIPRSSHRPVFDHLQYAKTEGESLVSFITWMMSVATEVDREGEGSLIERTHFVHTFFVLNQEWYTFRFTNVRNSSALGRNCKIRSLPLSFDSGTLPLSLHLGRHWCHSCDKWYQVFPLHFAYCKRSKLDGGKAWERGYNIPTVL